VTEDPRKTEATRVAERLREEIVQGRVRPASKLRLAALAERYGIGRGPLREAASKLAAEQLVVFEDHRGFRVAPISRDDLVDVTRTRQRIETLALRDAVRHGDDRWEGAVLAALHRLSKTSNLDPSRASPFSARHREFHAALCAACPSVYLRRFRETLYDHSERYRALAEHRYRRDASRDVPAEHEAIARAAVDRRADEACRLLEAHIGRTAQTLIESYPDLFREDVAPAEQQ
jgi:GntR family carbon starvation induced transcriptional regulator